ncbi:hypothetical protein V1519DRAFT_444927 [Lipomyces tetrasporus]
MPTNRNSPLSSNLPTPPSAYSETYFSLPSESPPSPVASPKAPHPSALQPITPSKAQKGNKRKGSAVPRKLNAKGTVRSDTLDPEPDFSQESQTKKSERENKPAQKSGWCSGKWFIFGDAKNIGNKKPKAALSQTVPKPTPSVRKNSSGSESSDSSRDYNEKETSPTPVGKSIRAGSTQKTMSDSAGYFAQGNGQDGSNPGFEQFPASTGPPFSPPDSDDADSSPPPQKGSWIGNLFSRKDKQPADEKETYRSPYAASNGPPSPPTSVLSTTSSVNTLRPNVNQSSVSLATSNGYSSYNRRDSTTNFSNASLTSTAPSAASTNTTNSNGNTWAFWSRMSSKSGDRSGSSISEDGVVAFSGPSAQSFIQKQRQGNREDDNASVISSDTVLVNPGPQRTLSRNTSRVSLNQGSYPNSLYNGSSRNLPPDASSMYNSNVSPPKISRSDTFRSSRDDTKTIRESSSRSVRNIETLGKPKQEVAAANTVKSSSGAKETALMAPPPTNAPADASTVKAEPVTTKKTKKTKDKDQIRYPSMVVPKLEDCLSHGSSASPLWTSLSKMGNWFGAPEEERLHVRLTTPPRIRKAVAIGIHGFFPIRMIRSIIGEPTGTSVKFANEAALAIQRWAEVHGQNVDIEKIALEGEGIVLDRVENLYRLLSNWMDHLHEADFIIVAAHSQGTPVAVQLVAKLIEEGHADKKKIGIMGMAGVSLGPFYGLDQKLVMRAYTQFESDSLKELFAFQNPESLQARRYIQALRTVIAHGVKVTYVGSVNDQLVPLYSSLCCHVNHPHIYRAIYVDGKVHPPSFIIHLIELLAKLRNMGLSDHGIVRDISDSLAGTLTGGGHSMIYNEHAVYDIAIKYALETTSIPDIPVKVHKFEVPMPSNYNPYHLPWSVRGMLEHDFVRKHLLDDVKRILNKFDDWNPESKPLKDIKYRLSAIRNNVPLAAV